MKIKILLVISFILLLNCLIIETEGTQNYIIVPDNYSTIQDAIDNAQENDIIIIRNGIFYENLYINKPLSLIGTDKNSTIINALKDGNVITITSDNVIMKNIFLTNSGVAAYDSAIFLNNAQSCYFENLIINNSQNGIFGIRSENIILDNSIIRKNICGLNFLFCKNLNFTNNIISSNYRDGLFLQGASQSYIENNSFNFNIKNNIKISSSQDILLSKNEIMSSAFGIYFHLTTDSVVFNNTIESNEIGIYLVGGGNNLLYSNKLLYNTLSNARSYSYNIWDNGYPSGGNQWSDFDEIKEGAFDFYCGPNQDLPGEDYIVDNPYYSIIGLPNIDRYPLIIPPIHAKIDIDPNKINAKSKGKYITCYIEFPTDAGFSVNDINKSTIIFNYTIHPVDNLYDFSDYNNNGIIELQVKFRRGEFIEIFAIDSNIEKEIIVSGITYDGTPFYGTDNIIIFKK